MDIDATARPRFKSCVEPVVDPDEGLFLFREGHRAWIPRQVFAALAPLLNGANAVEEIFETLSERHQSAEVFAALDRLRSGGYLADDALSLPRPQRSFWEHVGASPAAAQSRLTNTRLSVRVLGDTPARPLEELLLQQGLTLGAEPDLTVVVADHYLHPDLAEWNARALKRNLPWVLVRPVGIETWVGPAFSPGETACWECLAHRLRWHRRIEGYVGQKNGRTGFSGAPPAHLPASGTAALAELATEIARWVGVGGPSALANQVITTNVQTMERRHHRLVRRPQCPSCGKEVGPEQRQAKPMPLLPTPKLHLEGGGHRGKDPNRVVMELERHLSPITGIVGALDPGDRTSGDPDENAPTITFSADHNFSDAHDDRFFLQEGMRRRSGGKGKSSQQARISALAESLERYCGVHDGTEPRVRASYTELGGAAIHPNACTGYSAKQYAQRETLNGKAHKAHWVPEPFDQDTEIEWTPLWSLTNETTRYLPTSYCYFGYRSPDPVFARADSNGCAAGSLPEEAILQGLLELIERDAVALWWYNRLEKPAVALDDFNDPYVTALICHYQGLSRDIRVLDVTSDFDIPTFAALSRRTDKPEEDIIYGFGCHPDPKIAMTRALTELNQSLEAVPLANGPQAQRTYRGGPEAVDWWRNVRVDDNPYLRADPAEPVRRLRDFTNHATEDIAEDIRFCVDRAKTLGIEVLVLDQTRPDVGFPVVRVVAPGLRHFWARFGPGRLYDVPVQQGWLPRPLGEHELNPFVVQF